MNILAGTPSLPPPPPSYSHLLLKRNLDLVVYLLCAPAHTESNQRPLSEKVNYTGNSSKKKKKKKKDRAEDLGGENHKHPSQSLRCFSLVQKKSLSCPGWVSTRLFLLFFHFAIKIYNKQKKYRLPLCKSRPPSGSHRRLLCFLFSLPFFLSQKSPFIYSPAEFTLCSPPSETVSCSAVHCGPRLSSLPGSPPLFRVFSVTA